MSHPPETDPESQRLHEDARRGKNWKRWGPYLSERQWGTVREDYSANGDSWNYFSHDQARSRAYRWGEDGLLGITDRECRLCFALALWNTADPILKERLFGLTNGQGNHGEDVKECWFYLDSTPTHSYLKALYKYPQREFPYRMLVEENARRGKHDPELELIDTGIFEDKRYFDVLAEYAKAAPDDILIRITVVNRGPEPAVLHLLPTLWYRNTWSWGRKQESYWPKPRLELGADGRIFGRHESLGRFVMAVGPGPDGQQPTLLFTENETNARRLFGQPNAVPFVKDAFHEYVIAGRTDVVNPAGVGTKAAAHYVLTLPAGGTATLRLRLFAEADTPAGEPLGPDFERIFQKRAAEADVFFASRIPEDISAEQKRVSRQAYAGLLWSKQYYHYVVLDWLHGDPAYPPPPPSRWHGRNAEWTSLHNRDVVLMPDKWEYPWYAAWDLAFHVVALAKVDLEFAKHQLVLFLREWYMHSSGQLPAYEFAYSDVNPPVHAWACLRVYQMSGLHGQRDRNFLQRVFSKLLVNFTWWVNRKDIAGKNVFAGGFLGLDNIGLFDRSQPPSGVTFAQADGTGWMAFYCLMMLAMALELSRDEPAYEDIASKFFEHFVAIADAMNTLGGTGFWDEEEGFYYDGGQIGSRFFKLRARSIVGLIPLIAVVVLEEDLVNRLPGFKRRMDWFLRNRQDLARHISYCECHPEGAPGRGRQLLAIPSRPRLLRVLRYLLDENEFLSPYGIRSLSRWYRDHSQVVSYDGTVLGVSYDPAESTTGMFGGNSNWRGPIWFPVNYLLVEALQRYHHFYGDSLKVECPTGSGRMLNLMEVAQEISNRVVRLFLPDDQGRRPCHGDDARFADDPAWRDLVLFYEYFHGDNGRGCGANHQTGWSALVVRLLDKFCSTHPYTHHHRA
jgi:hypothetical protein